jgi:drug/metabolite transporter (DMT)-like permease
MSIEKRQNSDLHGHLMKNTCFYSFLGCLALVFWSSMPLLTTFVNGIPTFEILMIAYLISFLLTAIKLNVTNEWIKIKQPLTIWTIGVLCIFGNESLFISAIKQGPAEQMTLIFYLWPSLVFIVSYSLFKEKLSERYVLACIIGFIGVYLALTNDYHFHLEKKYIYGYELAISSAMLWSIYTIALRYYENLPYELTGVFFGFGAVFSAFIHFSVEKTILPNLTQLLTIVIMGLTTQGLAYILWDRGVKKGNYNLLYLLSYLNPLISSGWLFLFKLGQPTTTFVFACCLVILSNVMCHYKSSNHS